MKAKNSLSLSLLLILFTFLLLGCVTSSTFQIWNGPNEFTGTGGTCRTIEGIDIWENGTPNRKCKLLGIIDTQVLGSSQSLVFFGNSLSESAVVKEAKLRGGDAIIFISSDFSMYGFTNDPLAATKKKVAVIKYIDNSPEYGQESGTTVQANPSAEDRTLAFYENLSLQMQKLNANNKSKQVIELGEQYVDDENNKSALFFNEIGFAYLKIDKYDKAIMYLEKAVELDPNRIGPRINLGNIYAFKIKNYQKAKFHLNRYLVLIGDSDPHNAKDKIKSWLIKNGLYEN